MGGRRVYLGTADAAAYSGAYMFCLRFIFVFFFPTTLIGATAKPISSTTTKIKNITVYRFYFQTLVSKFEVDVVLKKAFLDHFLTKTVYRRPQHEKEAVQLQRFAIIRKSPAGRTEPRPRSRRHQVAAASHILSSRSQSYLCD